MIEVIIGIPVLNNIEITKACLQHLFRNTKTDRLNIGVSVLIIDNGSQNDIEQVLKNELKTEIFPIYFLKNPQNLGVAPAWNQILKFAPGQEVKKDFSYDYYLNPWH